jgi:hypothetical protein
MICAKKRGKYVMDMYMMVYFLFFYLEPKLQRVVLPQYCFQAVIIN